MSDEFELHLDGGIWSVREQLYPDNRGFILHRCKDKAEAEALLKVKLETKNNLNMFNANE